MNELELLVVEYFNAITFTHEDDLTEDRISESIEAYERLMDYLYDIGYSRNDDDRLMKELH